MKRNQLNQNGYRIGVAGGRPGFTLVEMLTVIVIIGILAALISAATIYARARAREAAIYVQIKQMEAALMEYKNQFGEFPPDFWGLHSSDPVVVTQAKQEVLRHLRRRWPRYQLRITVEPTDTPDKIIDKQFKAFADDVRALGIDPERFDAATALVFWLGGLPAEPLVSGATYQPAGFHADEEHPFQLGQPRTGPLFEFDPKRIDWASDHIWYRMDGPTSPPVVYFRAKKDAASGRSTYAINNEIAHFVYLLQKEDEKETADLAVAYLDGGTASATRVWRNPDTFQIVHPGLDGLYSELLTRVIPNPWPVISEPQRWPVTITAKNFLQGDFDNITNFAPKLESEIE